MKNTFVFFLMLSIFAFGCESQPPTESSEKESEVPVSKPRYDKSDNTLFPAGEWDFNVDYSSGEKEFKAVNYVFQYYDKKDTFPVLNLVIVDHEAKEVSASLMQEKASQLESVIRKSDLGIQFPLARTSEGKLIFYLYSDKALEKEELTKLFDGVGAINENNSKEEADWKSIVDYQ